MFLSRLRQPLPPSFLTNGLLGIAQILIWGGSFFLMAVMANPVVNDTHWPHAWVYGSLSVSLFLSGLLAPGVGKLITRQFGHALLLYSGFVVGLGLMVVAVAPVLGVFVLGWCIIGVGMAMGLFDALFAVIGQQYGVGAKGAITQITLVSGFCTTLTWPFMAWMAGEWGWRAACFGYALLLWITIWPLYKLALLRPGSPQPSSRDNLPQIKSLPTNTDMVWLLGLNFTLAAIIMAAISVQLIPVLQAKGISSTMAVGIGTLIGPCQVGVRLLDLVAPQKPPIWNTFISTTLTLLGVLCLNWSPAFAMAGVVLYSLGNGLRSIIRGTLPLTLFGPSTYPVVVGQLARPALIAQALTPLAGGLLVQCCGTTPLLLSLAGLALLNIGVTALIHYRLNHPLLPRSIRLLLNPLA